METNLIVEGLKFMVLGMGTVFSFLIIMILCMYLMSKVIHKYFPESLQDVASHKEVESDKKRVVAAITAAIMYHREHKG